MCALVFPSRFVDVTNLTQCVWIIRKEILLTVFQLIGPWKIPVFGTRYLLGTYLAFFRDFDDRRKSWRCRLWTSSWPLRLPWSIAPGDRLSNRSSACMGVIHALGLTGGVDLGVQASFSSYACTRHRIRRKWSTATAIAVAVDHCDGGFEVANG